MDRLAMVRSIEVSKERPCGGCQGAIMPGEACRQELWYSEGGPYLTHRHMTCRGDYDVEDLSNTAVGHVSRGHTRNGLADIEAAFKR